MRALALIAGVLVLVLAGCGARGPAAAATEGRPGGVLLPQAGAAADAVESWAPVLALDGKAGRYELRAVDPATGQQVAGRAPIGLGGLGGNEFSPAYGRSADGAWLVVTSGEGESCESYAGGTSCRPRAETIHVVDVQAWREVTGTLPVSGWAGPMAFSPDASRVALAMNDAKGSTIVVVDARTGQAVARQGVAFRPSVLGFAAGGAELVAYGQELGAQPGMTQPGPPQLLVADAATLAARWQQTLDGVTSGEWCTDNCDAEHGTRLMAYWQPGVVLARDGRTLVVAHADAERLTVVDVARRSVRGVDIVRSQSWLRQLLGPTVAHAKGPMAGAIKTAVLSPDGTRLFVAGQTMAVSAGSSGELHDESKQLGLQEIDVETGRVLAAAAPDATEVWAALDGMTLVAGGWQDRGPWAEIFAADGLLSIGRLSGWEVLDVRQAATGLALVARRYDSRLTSYAVLDAATRRVLAEWKADGYWTWVAGRQLP